MSGKNNTGDKLIASVRKSKTGTVAKKTSQRPARNESTAKSNASTANFESTTTNQRRNDGYSIGRRVWPD